ncbi:TPA: ISL3 family transposase, partial [Streptococcus equi subsp. zooepidemicus]|nr:ISL3 family transposase [Streptococcus equi subsp. zooepidemicus]
MSQYDFINNLLGIEDENIKITNFLGDFTENNVKYSYYEANLTYEPKFCPICGNSNRKYIHKHGSKITRPKLPKAGGKFIRLKLRKQRFLCLECGCTFSCKTTLCNTNKTISVPLRREIVSGITTKISEKDISKLNGVSHNTVNRIIDDSFEALDMKYNSLPLNLSFDEFKSTKRCKGNMSFVFCDSSNGVLLDIVENRQLPFLLKYFRKYTKQSRAKVKTILIDMYKPYMILAEKMFPNAKIAIDRFHIVQHINRALSKTRINVMKDYPTNSFEYKRLKKYWKLIQRKECDLDVSKYKHFTHFKYM